MGESPDPFKYDVAFSFLGRDEALAVALNERLRDRFATFIYSDSERQAAIAGRDGEVAFARVFGELSRHVVILFREGWGERGFTAPESTAIRDRAREVGWDFTTLIPLDTPPKPPIYFPKHRIGWVSSDGESTAPWQ